MEFIGQHWVGTSRIYPSFVAILKAFGSHPHGVDAGAVY
jgi:hypothetical protein